MLSALQDLRSSEAFMPHGMCYLWEPELLWTHVVADTLTWLAYWAIPFSLVYLVLRARREVPEGADYVERAIPYDWIFWAFGIFIVACGGTHLLAVWTVWSPDYWISGGVKVVTAMASVATAVALPPLIPRVLEVVRDARTSDLRRRRLEEANQELEALYRRLKEAEEARTHFFANVSHELRTPLTLILGPVRELLDGGEVKGPGRQALRTVEANARTLLGQVNDLLDVARMEAGSLPLRVSDADLSELVRGTAENFTTVARSREVRFEIRTPEALPALVDQGKLERIVLNLLSNAFKFTPASGSVRCTLERRDGGAEGETETPAAALVVEDSGPGVPAEEREQVFQRYRQARGGPATGAAGSGLGLAIVREFAEAMGGSAVLDEGEWGGARVTVLLPLRPPDPAEVEEVEGRRHPRRPGRDAPAPEGSFEPAHVANEPSDPAGTILVVDDNRDLCAYLARILGDEYRVHTAHDGLQGLRKALDVRPDLILTDIMMPVMTGEELLHETARHEALEDVPVIVLTARAEDALPARLLEAGAVDYVMKPMDAAELRARVRNTLELTRTRRVLESETEEGGPLQELAAEVARSRRALRRTVQQKQLVVQELHHRVKGNLQTISSLLSLQMRSLQDPAARGVLEEARGRIGAMALVHERLYGEDDATVLSLPEYLRSLVSMTVASHLDDPERVRVEVRSPPVTLPLDQAIPCGLLVHELLSNALLHGFPPGRSGQVQVALSLEGDPERLHLRVEDDGVGLDEEDTRSESLGLELVRALVGQLGGSMELHTQAGTSVEIRFPLETT